MLVSTLRRSAVEPPFAVTFRLVAVPPARSVEPPSTETVRSGFERSSTSTVEPPVWTIESIAVGGHDLDLELFVRSQAAGDPDAESPVLDVGRDQSREIVVGGDAGRGAGAVLDEDGEAVLDGNGVERRRRSGVRGDLARALRVGRGSDGRGRPVVCCCCGRLCSPRRQRRRPGRPRRRVHGRGGGSCCSMKVR